MPEHLGRTLSAMADAGIDALILGRAGNARYVSNAEVLSLTGTRPFAPGCVVVRATGKVHLLSITDSGIPSTIAHDQLYPLTWNPMLLAGNVAAIPGLADASTVGVDGMTPLMEQLLGAVLPAATFVDGESLLRAVRRPKSAADLDGIRRAVTVTEQCVAATLAAVAPGVTERQLLGTFEATMGGLGTTTPAFEASVCVAGAKPRWITSDRALRTGDLVNLRGGVLVDGWEGVLARTRGCGGATGPQAAAGERATAALADATAACVPGSLVGDLRTRADVTALDGVGLGHEELADDDTLAPGDVVYVEVFVNQVLLGDLVHVTERGPILLTTTPLGVG
jgi:Xaa-Pro aminopeptidase